MFASTSARNNPGFPIRRVGRANRGCPEGLHSVRAYAIETDCTKVIVVWNVHRQRKPKKCLFSLTEHSPLEDWVRCVDNTQYMI